MAEDIDDCLLTGCIKRKFIVKVRPFLSAKTVEMQDYIKPTKPDFEPSLYLLHVGTNDLLLEDTPKAMSERIIATAENYCRSIFVKNIRELMNNLSLSN